MSLDAVSPAVSRIALSRLMTGADVNLLGTVHGGVMMKIVDDAAGLVATRHSLGPAVTAAMDEMAFLFPVHVGELVHTYAQVNWTGRTSMEVGVRVEAEPWNVPDRTPVHVATAFLTFVAIDAEGRPREVPQLLLECAEDERRFHEATIRRKHRLARRAAIAASRHSETFEEN
ncbi:MAG TPA: acyl-CoA thioesterase [Actinospica sp.]|jgi:acyl-CoA hydrolase|nr:acyl-CoA thioesterase [Actinospica sp.]